jgi:hypothetical protein
VAVLVEERADDGRERDRRSDREVDPARHDYQQLAERENRDDRGLREHVPEVRARAKDRRRGRDDGDEEDEDQEWPGAQRDESKAKEVVAVEGEPPPAGLGYRSSLVLRFGHHDLLNHQTPALVGEARTRHAWGASTERSDLCQEYEPVSSICASMS